jgi:hypothetical protein
VQTVYAQSPSQNLPIEKMFSHAKLGTGLGDINQIKPTQVSMNRLSNYLLKSSEKSRS